MAAAAHFGAVARGEDVDHTPPVPTEELASLLAREARFVSNTADGQLYCFCMVGDSSEYFLFLATNFVREKVYGGASYHLQVQYKMGPALCKNAKGYTIPRPFR